MESQNSAKQQFTTIALQFSEPVETEEFKTKVCMPYFKDIFKDLQERSDSKTKGINKLSMLDYSQLPGLLAERFFFVLDADNDGYLNLKEFMNGMLNFYCSTFEEKLRLVFNIYDFNNDGFISKVDVTTLISCLPISIHNKIRSEGKYTAEGGGVQNFQERVDTLEEMFAILDVCFGKREQVNFEQFVKITEEVSSDMVLAVLSILRERLPCSENYWRYRRNFELSQANQAAEQNSESGQMKEGMEVKQKVVAGT